MTPKRLFANISIKIGNKIIYSWLNKGDKMKLKETYKKKITTEIKDLSESEMEKVIKMIHLLKTEFLGEERKASVEGFKKAKGAWKDVDVDEIYKKLNEDWKRWKPLKSV